MQTDSVFKVLLLSSHLLISRHPVQKSKFGACAVTGYCSFKCSNLCIAFIDSINFRYSYPVPCSFITWLNLIKQARSHPRRPRGSKSGWEKRRDESFQVRAKEPLGTDSHRTISKNSSGCRLQIGHKKCFVLLCPIGEQFLLSFFREFVHDGPSVHQACACEGNFYFLLS